MSRQRKLDANDSGYLAGLKAARDLCEVSLTLSGRPEVIILAIDSLIRAIEPDWKRKEVKP